MALNELQNLAPIWFYSIVQYQTFHCFISPFLASHSLSLFLPLSAPGAADREHQVLHASPTPPAMWWKVMVGVSRHGKWVSELVFRRQRIKSVIGAGCRHVLAVQLLCCTLVTQNSLLCSVLLDLFSSESFPNYVPPCAILPAGDTDEIRGAPRPQAGYLDTVCLQLPLDTQLPSVDITWCVTENKVTATFADLPTDANTTRFTPF